MEWSRGISLFRAAAIIREISRLHPDKKTVGATLEMTGRVLIECAAHKYPAITLFFPRRVFFMANKKNNLLTVRDGHFGVHTVMNKTNHLYHVYIMTNRWHSVLYTGMTGWGLYRIRQHIEKIKPGFTKRYNINKLVYLEEFADVTDAIAREKQIKRWSRKKKEWLIEQQNPGWEDLFLKYTIRKQKGR